MRILHVNTHDTAAGGAAKFAWDLFGAFRRAGHCSWMAVGEKRSDDPDVFVIPNRTAANPWTRFWHDVQTSLVRLNTTRRMPGTWRLSRGAAFLANPAKWWDQHRGIEDFHFPGCCRLLELPPGKPDIVHLHNLNGDYFDLRILPPLSRQMPLIATLHDEWLLTGHCGYSMGCERWQTGCGECPDLNRYPPIARDATAHNWRRKQHLFRQSRLFVVAPSKWIYRRATRAMFSPHQCRHIPHGVDLEVFHPLDKAVARRSLGVPTDKILVLFLGARARVSPFKDYATFEAALQRLDRQTAQGVYAVSVGDKTSDHTETVGHVTLRLIPYQTDQRKVAGWFQAADLFVHPTRIDNFPLAVLESLACGTPVIATAIGGIPEQVRGIAGIVPGLLREQNCFPNTDATGLLVPPLCPDALAAGVTALVKQRELCRQLGENAARDAQTRFDLRRCADAYLTWYREILAEGHRPSVA